MPVKNNLLQCNSKVLWNWSVENVTLTSSARVVKSRIQDVVSCILDAINGKHNILCVTKALSMAHSFVPLGRTTTY